METIAARAWELRWPRTHRQVLFASTSTEGVIRCEIDTEAAVRILKTRLGTEQVFLRTCSGSAKEVGIWRMDIPFGQWA